MDRHELMYKMEFFLGSSVPKWPKRGMAVVRDKLSSQVFILQEKYVHGNRPIGNARGDGLFYFILFLGAWYILEF